jgi:hypothetical protein
MTAVSSALRDGISSNVDARLFDVTASARIAGSPSGRLDAAAASAARK